MTDIYRSNKNVSVDVHFTKKCTWKCCKTRLQGKKLRFSSHIFSSYIQYKVWKNGLQETETFLRCWRWFLSDLMRGSVNKAKFKLHEHQMFWKRALRVITKSAVLPMCSSLIYEHRAFSHDPDFRAGSANADHMGRFSRLLLIKTSKCLILPKYITFYLA